jgi:hypothetical protein
LERHRKCLFAIKCPRLSRVGFVDLNPLRKRSGSSGRYSEIRVRMSSKLRSARKLPLGVLHLELALVFFQKLADLVSLIQQPDPLFIIERDWEAP